MNSSVSVATCAMSCDVHMICDDLMKEIVLERLYLAARYEPNDENKPYHAVLIVFRVKMPNNAMCYNTVSHF